LEARSQELAGAVLAARERRERKDAWRVLSFLPPRHDDTKGAKAFDRMTGWSGFFDRITECTELSLDLAASERRERKDVSAALEIQGGISSVEDVFSL